MLYLSKENATIQGHLRLNGSKSISNRVLIIRALCGKDFEIPHLSNSKDTLTLQALLAQVKSDTGEGMVYDAGAAGTTFRFMTAFLALQPGTQILTGTERMKQRPIKILVEALRQLGAQIEYLEQEGYPPLRIESPISVQGPAKLTIKANTSSQYISALLLIGPTLPEGIELTLEGTIVSRPYIEMTLRIMGFFGVKHRWEGQVITVPAQDYQAKDFVVEADWSAASYYYALAALADACTLQLDGLFRNSLQGDAVLQEMMPHFGVETAFTSTGIQLTKKNAASAEPFQWDFIRCPDLAQTLAVICAGTGTPATFKGLETLRIKETDRIAAIKQELNKVGADFIPAQDTPDGAEWHQVLGKAVVLDPVFDTYEDHRMAMAFAPLALFAKIGILEPEVVKKSYPDFWTDLEQLGFLVEPTV